MSKRTPSTSGSKMFHLRHGPHGKDSMHKHAAGDASANYKEQLAVYGSAFLFFAWLWGSLVYSVIGVGLVLGLAHALTLACVYRDALEKGRALEYLRTHPPNDQGLSSTKDKKTVDPMQILQDL